MARTSYRTQAELKSLVASPSQFIDTPLFADFNTSAVAVEWTALPTYQNSWADKAGYQAGQYRVTSLGVVKLRGVIDSGTKTAGTLITTLPAGARPPAKTVLVVNPIVDATSNNAGSIVIDTDGTVKVGGTTLTASSYISLAGLEFDTNT